TFRSHGWASSTTATSGKRSSDPPISPRCGRAASRSRTASRRSNARPSCSSASGSYAESGTRDLLFQLLDAPEARVDAGPAQELFVATALDHAAGLEDDDAAGRARGAEPVRHQEHRPPRERLAQVGQDLLLFHGVDGGEGVVEHEDRRSARERSRQGDALALAARQGQAALADDGLESL